MNQAPTEPHATNQDSTVRTDPARCGQSWCDVPIRVKLILIILLASVGGCLVEMVESHLGDLVWPLCCGLTLLVTILWWLSHCWTWRPIDHLLRQAEHLSRTRASPSEAKLPLARRDEIGQFARAYHALMVTSMRDRHEARRLRRTMDSRVEKETRQATIKLHQMTMRDPMTDLANRRFLDENLGPLFESVQQSNTDLVCIAIDMDNFKNVNDSLGHAAGDELIVFLASLIRACVRKDDYTIRLGGDEFLALMPECEMSRVEKFCAQLRALFRQHVRAILPPDLQTDLSIGVASVQRDAIDHARGLLEVADANLYAAKNQGKGSTVI